MARKKKDVSSASNESIQMSSSSAKLASREEEPQVKLATNQLCWARTSSKSAFWPAMVIDPQSVEELCTIRKLPVLYIVRYFDESRSITFVTSNNWIKSWTQGVNDGSICGLQTKAFKKAVRLAQEQLIVPAVKLLEVEYNRQVIEGSSVFADPQQMTGQQTRPNDEENRSLPAPAVDFADILPTLSEDSGDEQAQPMQDIGPASMDRTQSKDCDQLEMSAFEASIQSTSRINSTPPSENQPTVAPSIENLKSVYQCPRCGQAMKHYMRHAVVINGMTEIYGVWACLGWTNETCLFPLCQRNFADYSTLRTMDEIAAGFFPSPPLPPPMTIRPFSTATTKLASAAAVDEGGCYLKDDTLAVSLGSNNVEAPESQSIDSDRLATYHEQRQHNDALTNSLTTKTKDPNDNGCEMSTTTAERRAPQFLANLLLQQVTKRFTKESQMPKRGRGRPRRIAPNELSKVSPFQQKASERHSRLLRKRKQKDEVSVGISPQEPSSVSSPPHRRRLSSTRLTQQPESEQKKKHCMDEQQSNKSSVDSPTETSLDKVANERMQSTMRPQLDSVIVGQKPSELIRSATNEMLKQSVPAAINNPVNRLFAGWKSAATVPNESDDGPLDTNAKCAFQDPELNALVQRHITQVKQQLAPPPPSAAVYGLRQSESTPLINSSSLYELAPMDYQQPTQAKSADWFVPPNAAAYWPSQVMQFPPTTVGELSMAPFGPEVFDNWATPTATTVTTTTTATIVSTVISPPANDPGADGGDLNDNWEEDQSMTLSEYFGL